MYLAAAINNNTLYPIFSYRAWANSSKSFLEEEDFNDELKVLKLRDTNRCKYCTAFKLPTESIGACCGNGKVIPPPIPETFFPCYHEGCKATFTKEQSLQDHCSEQHDGIIINKRWDCQLDFTLEYEAALLTNEDEEIK